MVAHDRGALADVCEWAFAPGVPLLMTEIVPGPETDICTYFTHVDEHGEPLYHYTKSKIAERTPA